MTTAPGNLSSPLDFSTLNSLPYYSTTIHQSIYLHTYIPEADPLHRKQARSSTSFPYPHHYSFTLPTHPSLSALYALPSQPKALHSLRPQTMGAGTCTHGPQWPLSTCASTASVLEVPERLASTTAPQLWR